MNRNAALAATYRHLLRWYPRSWRRDNGDALLGALLDQAEAEGRSVPTAGERVTLLRGGLAQRFRLTRRSSSGITALVGGAVLLVATVVPAAAEFVFFFPQPRTTGWLYLTWQPVFAPVAAAVLVLAFAVLALGFGREAGIAGGSVVGRVGLMLYPLALGIAGVVGSQSLPLGTSPDLLSAVRVTTEASAAVALLALILAAVAAFRAGVVRGPARWMLPALAIATGASVVLGHVPDRTIGTVALAAYPVSLVLRSALGAMLVAAALPLRGSFRAREFRGIL